jgi:hypothetical protein
MGGSGEEKFWGGVRIGLGGVRMVEKLLASSS